MPGKYFDDLTVGTRIHLSMRRKMVEAVTVIMNKPILQQDSRV